MNIDITNIAVGYQIYLMVELAKLNGVIEKEIEYDTQWEEAEELFKNFYESKFNNPNQPEIECIEAFLKDYIEYAFTDFLRSECVVYYENTYDSNFVEKMLETYIYCKINNMAYWIPSKNIYFPNEPKTMLIKFNGYTKTLHNW